jgi:hypothetical protein
MPVQIRWVVIRDPSFDGCDCDREALSVEQSPFFNGE